ncbi:hypothetical protein [Fontibacter flavus]|uniref:DUF4234 domain-containing protein n=1 Tax=Fontibacter flavus TaxID=654838 RepID=A0ABV6FR99_9BACT
MKVYYYFLFRIYRLYKDKNKETDSQALFSATAVSTTTLSINVFSFYGVLDYFDLVPTLENKYITILIMLIFGWINHYFFVRERKFLNYGFQKDKKGGFLIVAYLILSVFFAVTEAQFNRKKIFKENVGQISNEPRKESLEGKIRKWFE